MGFMHMGGCRCGDVFDFFAPPHASEAGIVDAVNGHVLVRAPSLLKFPVDAGKVCSLAEWSLDVADLGVAYTSIWASFSATYDNRRHRVWYFLTNAETDDPADYRIEVVDVGFNQAPTSVATLDGWSGFLGAGKRLQFHSLTEGSIARRTPDDFPAVPALVSGNTDTDWDLTDESSTLWHPVVTGTDNEVAAGEQTYISDYRPLRAARNNAEYGVGFRVTVTIEDTTWTGGAFGSTLTGGEITDYRLEIVLGELSIDVAGSSITNATTLYDLTSVAFRERSTANNRFVAHDAEVVRCKSLEHIDGSYVGIFEYKNDSTLTSWSSTPASIPAEGETRVVPTYLTEIEFGSLGQRIDILTPQGSLVDSGASTSQPYTDIPFMISHGLSESGGPNGSYFLLVANSYLRPADLVNGTAGKLRYMTGTTVHWEKSFAEVPRYMQVSDRFVYVYGTKASGSQLTYAYDYDGNEYRLYRDTDGDEFYAFDPSKNATLNDSDSYNLRGEPGNLSDPFQRWALVQYSDNLSPTRALMQRHD